MESRPSLVDPPAFLVAIMIIVRILAGNIVIPAKNCILKKYSRNYRLVNMEGENEDTLGSTYATFTTFASLVSGFLLLVTGFFAGWYWQGAAAQEAIRVEIVENAPAPTITPIEAEAALGSESEAEETLDAENCQFVGSKNSDKFHSPGSGSAKRIKPENIVCFASEADALEAGYEEGTIDE